jgi:hypothetical protein
VKFLKLSIILLFAAISLKAQSLPDSCKYSRAWYDVSIIQDYPLLKTLPKGISIIADTALKPVNFVSQHEEYFRIMVSGFYTPHKPWKELQDSFKFFNTSNYDSTEKFVLDNLKDAEGIHMKNSSKDFTVWIVNNSKDTIKIPAQDGSIMAIKEAKDKKGKWRPIEYWAYSGCGVSYQDVLIAPGKSVQFPANSSKGDFTTKVRFKIIGKNKFMYSNEFTETVPSCLLKTQLLGISEFHSLLPDFRKIKTMSFPSYGNVFHPF